MTLLCMPPRVKVGAMFREAPSSALLTRDTAWEIMTIREGGTPDTTYITLYHEGENVHTTLANLLQWWEPVS
jgi:hypothetical protein